MFQRNCIFHARNRTFIDEFQEVIQEMDPRIHCSQGCLITIDDVLTYLAQSNTSPIALPITVKMLNERTLEAFQSINYNIPQDSKLEWIVEVESTLVDILDDNMLMATLLQFVSIPIFLPVLTFDAYSFELISISKIKIDGASRIVMEDYFVQLLIDSMTIPEKLPWRFCRTIQKCAAQKQINRFTKLIRI